MLEGAVLMLQVTMRNAAGVGVLREEGGVNLTPIMRKARKRHHQHHCDKQYANDIAG